MVPGRSGNDGYGYNECCAIPQQLTFCHIKPFLKAFAKR